MESKLPELEFPQKNLDKILQYIEHDIIMDLYSSNKDNAEKKDLITKLSNKYQELYKIDILKADAYNAKHKKIFSTYIIPEGTNINDIYIEKVKNVCNEFGVNVEINPKEPNPLVSIKNSYTVITEDNYFDHLPMGGFRTEVIRKGLGVSILSNNPELNSDLNHKIYLLKENNRVSSKKMNFTITLTKDLIPNEIICDFLSTMHIVEVPDAPVAKNVTGVTNNIQNVMEKFSSTNKSNNQNKLN